MRSGAGNRAKLLRIIGVRIIHVFIQIMFIEHLLCVPGIVLNSKQRRQEAYFLEQGTDNKQKTQQNHRDSTATQAVESGPFHGADQV